jgi:Na+-driven multidrug efflux pump
VILPIAVGIAALIINTILNLLLVTGAGYTALGFTGAPIATSLARISSLVIMSVAMLILHFREKRKSGQPFGPIIPLFILLLKDAVRWSGIKHYIIIAIPSIITMCMDFWFFQVCVILSSRFGEKSLASS